MTDHWVTAVAGRSIGGEISNMLDRKGRFQEMQSFIKLTTDVFKIRRQVVKTCRHKEWILTPFWRTTRALIYVLLAGEVFF